jgi:uncharacterized protein with HEPN domain
MKDDRVYLLHARDAIRHIVDYTAEGKDAFLTDRRTQDAVVRNLQVLGEAIKHLSATVKQSHPDIPWKSIAGMRDKLIHDYFGINLELVWDVVETHLPLLQSKINQLLGEMSEPR